MIRLLDSVPWFVISAFVASAGLAIAAGMRSPAEGPGRDGSTAARFAGFVYGAAVAVVVVLWVRETWS